MFHIEFGFDWSSGFREDRYLNIIVIFMYIASGKGQASPLGPFFSQNHISSVHLPISFMFFSSNDILTIFLGKCIGHLC